MTAEEFAKSFPELTRHLLQAAGWREHKYTVPHTRLDTRVWLPANDFTESFDGILLPGAELAEAYALLTGERELDDVNQVIRQRNHERWRVGELKARQRLKALDAAFDQATLHLESQATPSK